MIAFIKNGSTLGARYGVQGQGSGRMPGFGSMLTDEQIRAIVEYVRSL
jgi:mono/diheme cytochrome c family protein